MKGPKPILLGAAAVGLVALLVILGGIWGEMHYRGNRLQSKEALYSCRVPACWGKYRPIRERTTASLHRVPQQNSAEGCAFQLFSLALDACCNSS